MSWGWLHSCPDEKNEVESNLPKIRQQVREETWGQAQVCLLPASVNFPLCSVNSLKDLEDDLGILQQTKQPVPYCLG